MSWGYKEVSHCAVLNFNDGIFFPQKKRLQENHIPWLWQVSLLSWSWLHRRLLYTSHSHQCPLLDREAHQWPGTERKTTGFWLLDTGNIAVMVSLALVGKALQNSPIKLNLTAYLYHNDYRKLIPQLSATTYTSIQPLHHLKTQQMTSSAAMVKANQVLYLLL